MRQWFQPYGVGRHGVAGHEGEVSLVSGLPDLFLCAASAVVSEYDCTNSVDSVGGVGTADLLKTISPAITRYLRV